MADDLYVVDAYPPLFPPRPAVVDDGTGRDWLVINSGAGTRGEINLGFRLENGVAVAAAGTIREGFNTTLATVEVTGAVENARGGDGDDLIQGNALGNVLVGDRTAAGGDDTLYGRDGADRIEGGAGDDDLRGDGGDDVILGGTGDDFVLGGAGADAVAGGRGADRLDGGGEAGDVLSYAASSAGVRVLTNTDAAFGAACTGGDAQGDAVSNFATIVGSRFADSIRDLDAFDVRDAGGLATNDNTFDGGAGNDRLLLGGGDDLGRGGAGRDALSGEAGRDRLEGGIGADVLRGGTGRDVLLGGGGADAFVFAAVGDSRAGAARDVVADFARAGGDVVDLSRLDAVAGTAPNDAFAFVGARAFSGEAGELRAVAGPGGLRLSGDVNGDRVADVQVLLLGVTRLGADDLLL